MRSADEEGSAEQDEGTSEPEESEEDGSEAGSEAEESSGRSRSSKPNDPGKPDELSMGGAIGGNGGGKESPDTGSSYALLIALGTASFTVLAAAGFKKCG